MKRERYLRDPSRKDICSVQDLKDHLQAVKGLQECIEKGRSFDVRDFMNCTSNYCKYRCIFTNNRGTCGIRTLDFDYRYKTHNKRDIFIMIEKLVNFFEKEIGLKEE